MAAEAACLALGITAVADRSQVLLAPGGPRVMEVGPRLGGGHDAELCKAALGVDLSAAAVNAALGRRRAARRDARAGGRRALPDRAGGASRARRRAGRGGALPGVEPASVLPRAPER